MSADEALKKGVQFDLSIRNRFNSFIMPEPITGCWIWSGSLGCDGYGRLRVFGIDVRANRIAYELYKGPITKGLFVCHTCDNRWCVNPDHLWLGTCRENSLDMLKKGRDNPKFGMNHKNSKLTDDDVRRIRIDVMIGLSQCKIAEKYGVKQATISDIIVGKSWKHVPVIERGSSDDYPIIDLKK